MEEDITATLEKDEKILWSASPEAFTVLDKTNKKPFLVKLIEVSLVCMSVIVFYMVFMIKNNGDIKPVLIAIILAIGTLIAMGTFLDAKNIRKQKYYLTDRNLIRTTDAIQKIPLNTIKNYVFREDADGHTCLLIGEDTIHSSMNKWRSFAARPICFNESNGICEQAAFYALPSAKKFEHLLNEKLVK